MTVKNACIIRNSVQDHHASTESLMKNANITKEHHADIAVMQKSMKNITYCSASCGNASSKSRTMPTSANHLLFPDGLITDRTTDSPVKHYKTGNKKSNPYDKQENI